MTPPCPHSFHSLYDHHHNWLKSVIYRRLGCREMAADLAHDAFVRLLNRPVPFGDAAHARGYLRKMADRLCIDLWRRRSVEQAWLEVLAQRPEARALSPEEHAVIVETFCEIDALLQRLPEKVASAFLMSQIEGKTYREIAAHLGVSERTIKTYMARAMLECVLIEARCQDALTP